MADIKKVSGAPDCCNDGCCDKCKRGKRGKRGRTGPTGPASMLSGASAPDEALVAAAIGTHYWQIGTSIIWVKYGPNDYNWRPLSCDPMDGAVRAGLLADAEFSVTNYTSTAGTATAANSGGEPGRLSVFVFSVTSNVTPDRTRNFFAGGGSPAQGIVPGGGAIYMFKSIKIPTLSDGANAFQLRLLGGDSLVATANLNGVWIENDFAAYGDNNWRGRTCLGGVNSTVDLGVAPTAGAWTKIGAVINSLGTLATFLVDDVAVGTLATNIPVAAANGFALQDIFFKTTGAAGVLTYQHDYYYSAMLSSAQR